MILRSTIVAMIVLLSLHGQAWAAAQRVVSLNLCTDELVLRLADRSRIASVTWLSQDRSGSNVPDLAAAVAINHGLAEQVIAAQPDLVVAGIFTTRTTVAMLKRTDIPVVEFGVPRTLDDARRQILDMARLLQEERRGEALVAAMDTRIAKASGTRMPYRPTAVVLNPNGFTVGKDTLVDQILTAAGLENIAARLRMDNYGQIPLELVAAHAIDVLIVSASRDGPPALATEILRHPVLAKLDGTRIVSMPGRLWSCAGPSIAEAVERLSVVARDVARNKAAQQ